MGREAVEQEFVVKWASMQSHPALKWLFHIPNGGSRNIAEAAHLKRMGVKSGVPDLFLPYPVGDFHGLWIELKADKGRVMGSQREWIEYLRSQGYAAYVCRGAEQAINCIQLYLSDYKYTVRNDGAEDERKGEYISFGGE